MIKYPIKKTSILSQNQTSVNNIKTFTKRGMTLESLLNITNEYYLTHDIAMIYKKPTPIQIVHVAYPSRNKAKIDEAYFKTPSTTDYNGIYKGCYIDFEAKETNSKTSFSLNNVHEHQIKHLNGVIKHGGIGFLIIGFTLYDEYFLVSMDFFNKYWNNQTIRKSIPYADIKTNCKEIPSKVLLRLDYLQVLDEIYF